MRDFIHDNLIAIIIVACFLVFSILLIGGIYSGTQKHHRLMTQCMADGKKEYECEAMLKSKSVPVVVPMCIPR